MIILLHRMLFLDDSCLLSIVVVGGAWFRAFLSVIDLPCVDHDGGNRNLLVFHIRSQMF